MEEYKSKADFDVKLIFQENQGRFMAFNKAVDMAKGELFIPADSDDSFEPHTIEWFNNIWCKYKSNNISGISVLCKYIDGEIVGEKFPIEGVTCFKDIVFKHKVGGEKWGCVRTDILKEHKYPSQYNVKRLPDLFVWYPIGFKYETVYMNEPLRTYYTDAGNQLTHQKDQSKDYMEMKNDYTLMEINYVLPHVRRLMPIKDKMEKFVYLWLTAFKSDRSIVSVLRKVERPENRLAAVLLLLPSFLINKLGLKLEFLKRKKYRYQIQPNN